MAGRTYVIIAASICFAAFQIWRSIGRQYLGRDQISQQFVTAQRIMQQVTNANDYEVLEATVLPKFLSHEYRQKTPPSLLGIALGGKDYSNKKLLLVRKPRRGGLSRPVVAAEVTLDRASVQRSRGKHPSRRYNDPRMQRTTGRQQTENSNTPHVPYPPPRRSKRQRKMARNTMSRFHYYLKLVVYEESLKSPLQKSFASSGLVLPTGNTNTVGTTGNTPVGKVRQKQRNQEPKEDKQLKGETRNCENGGEKMCAMKKD
eukprot:g1015.t1